MKDGQLSRRGFTHICLLIGLCTLLCSPSAYGQGILDPSFGRGGIAITPASLALRGAIVALAEDHAGRLMAAAAPSECECFGVLRYLENGSLDKSFAAPLDEKEPPMLEGGFAFVPFDGRVEPEDVAITRSGSILVVGSSGAGPDMVSGGFALAQYREDGNLDHSFGRAGRVVTYAGPFGGARAVAVQSDGGILVVGFRKSLAGRSDGVLIRYNEDGSIDRDFGKQGRVRFAGKGGFQADLHDVLVLPNQKILLAGRFRGRFMVARLLPDGRPDRHFGGSDGRVLTNVHGAPYCASGQCAYASSIAVHEGRITAAGDAVNGRKRRFVALVRYRSNGRLDRRFGQEGVVRIRRGVELFAGEMVIRHDGRIIFPAEYYKKPFYEPAVIGRLPNGLPDPSFGRDGFFFPRIRYYSGGPPALLQRDGRVVIGGYVIPKEPRMPHYTLLRFR